MEKLNNVVYLHEDLEGIPFYVGSGKIERAFLKEKESSKINATKRGKDYSYKVKSLDFNYNVRLVCENLSKTESIKIEAELYEKYIETLVNKNKPSSQIIMDDFDFSEYLKYDDTSVSCLRWVKSQSKKCRVGDQAGGVRTDGYFNVRINGIAYMAHRIVAVLNGIKVDGKVIDHVDHNKQNNRISNLRAVSQQENVRNTPLNKRNTSGTVGVVLSKIKCNKTGKYYYGWVAEWRESGKHCVKRFPFNEGDEEGSNLAYDKAVTHRKTIEKSQGYGVNHGKVSETIPLIKRKQGFIQIDKRTMTVVCIFDSMQEILKKHPDFHKEPIYAVANGSKKSYRGYIWENFTPFA